jgi:hypothetical protein
MNLVMRSTKNATFSCDAETAEQRIPVTNTVLATTAFPSLGVELQPLPGYLGSGQFLVPLCSDDSLDLTLFVDGLPVLVRRCVGP